MLINVPKDFVRDLIINNCGFSDEATDALLEYYEDITTDGFAFDPTKLDEDWTEYETSDIMAEFGYLVEDEMEDYGINDVLDELDCCTTVFRLENNNYLVCDW